MGRPSFSNWNSQNLDKTIYALGIINMYLLQHDFFSASLFPDLDGTSCINLSDTETFNHYFFNSSYFIKLSGTLQQLLYAE